MKNDVKSELILEISKGFKRNSGLLKEVKKIGRNIKQTSIKITDKDLSQKIGRDVGSYISLSFDDLLYYDYNAKSQTPRCACTKVED